MIATNETMDSSFKTTRTISIDSLESLHDNEDDNYCNSSDYEVDDGNNNNPFADPGELGKARDYSTASTNVIDDNAVECTSSNSSESTEKQLKDISFNGRKPIDTDLKGSDIIPSVAVLAEEFNSYCLENRRKKKRVVVIALNASAAIDGCDDQLLPASFRALEVDLKLFPSLLGRVALAQSMALSLSSPVW